MKKILLTLLLIFCFATPCFATHYDGLGIGDSVMYGLDGATDGPMPTLYGSSYLNTTYINTGASGQESSYGVSHLPGWLTSYTPYKVWDNFGVNDAVLGVAMSTWLANKATMYSDVIATGATYYAMQITPDSGYGDTIKVFNANLEDWAFLNNIPMSPTYQDLTSTSTDDYCNSTAYACANGVHLNAAGDVVYGYLMYRSSIPGRYYDFGGDYPDIKHGSFSRWDITGGSLVGGTTDSVIGYTKGGTLTLGANNSSVSPVIAILPNNNIWISTAGTVGTTYYRHSASNFTRSAASPSWTTYTGAVTPLSAGTAEFFQIKYSGTSAVTLSKLDWSGTTYYTVTPSAGTGGSISPSSPQTVSSGSTTQFTYSANSGYAFNAWGGTCGGSGTTTYTTSAITANCTVTASFTQIENNTVVNGECGVVNGTYSYTTPTQNLCLSGSASPVTLGNHVYSYSCVGAWGGITVNCTVNQSINGDCGSSNGQLLNTTPTTGLCDVGVPSAVSLNTLTFMWFCSRVGLGVDAECEATYNMPPVSCCAPVLKDTRYAPSVVGPGYAPPIITITP